jgi:hypothetical protein
MKRLLIALALICFPAIAQAQCNGVFAAHTVCGNPTGSAGIPTQIPQSAITGIPGGTNGQTQYNNAGAFGGYTLSQDCTVNTTTGVITCTKTNNVSFAPSATTDTTNAANISSGTLPYQRLPAGSSTVTGASTTYIQAQNYTVVNRSNAGSPMADTLPGTSPGVLAANSFITVTNVDTAGILSIKVGTGTSFKTSTASTGYIYVCPGQTVRFYSDGSNYWALDRPTRCVLKAATTIYVATTGSATNDGLTASTPLLDPTFAYNLAGANLDLATQNLTFQLANGTYSGILMDGPLLGAFFNRFTIGVFMTGNPGSPSSVVISHSGVDPPSLGAIEAVNGAYAVVDGFQVSSTTIDDITAFNNSALQIKDIIFGAPHASQNHISAAFNSIISITGSYTITAGGGCHMIAVQGSTVETLDIVGTITATITGTPAFTSGFACVQYPSSIVINTPITYSGSATGARYSGNFNGIINTAGGGATFFPGNSAGVLSTGAQYN